MIVRELATDNTDQPVRAPDPDFYKEEDLYTYEEARKMKPQLVPYIAAEFHARDFDQYENFLVGDGKWSKKVSDDIVSRRRRRRRRDNSNTEFYNGPLEEKTFYAVFQRAYVKKVSSRTFYPRKFMSVYEASQQGAVYSLWLVFNCT